MRKTQVAFRTCTDGTTVVATMIVQPAITLRKARRDSNPSNSRLALHHVNMGSRAHVENPSKMQNASSLNIMPRSVARCEATFFPLAG
jgi:hypothetical protein